MVKGLLFSVGLAFSASVQAIAEEVMLYYQCVLETIKAQQAGARLYRRHAYIAAAAAGMPRAALHQKTKTELARRLIAARFLENQSYIDEH